ncbi:aldehyde dehydrogenase (NADP(+)) [Granulosicoccus antarcticus]|uniref:NADP-dependent fatty aldehyde dehydrogenase n=1 Tax=Granulosicoccus antarcticus IMCC3135 TaxID=1192854 RepID=A0A2Z2NHW6_9GAMM|nr:aldehyde dehydrogenase (NADP(+)) [Granulosicoccus antarcticus]ASJ70892.1 NADP-dependent fatty aldehyde dehydrogenase [Granulosicoccus antarcticus IMCC3135]
MTLYGSRIAGKIHDDGPVFENDPVSGERSSFTVGTPELVEQASKAAADAFKSYGRTTRVERAEFLRTIAAEIELRGPAITAMGVAETGLPAGRLEGERGRTTGQLKLFAEHIEKAEYLDIRHDAALPDRAPAPRPDLRLMQRPLGPVAVFGASNFPLAFSTAGGDTASALAAGCPVVVKGHPGHPGTAAIVGEAIDAAVSKCNLHPGTFSLLNDGGPGNEGADSRAVGAALVQSPFIKAVGFTGSLGGGRALYDLASRRAEPIPFFGELGSVNPVFVLSAAAEARGAQLGKEWAGSLTMGVGQFCTNPGIVVIPSESAQAFEESAVAALADVPESAMLTSGIASAYRNGVKTLSNHAGVRIVQAPEADGRGAAPVVLAVTAEDFIANPGLAHEVFGPVGIIVSTHSNEQMLTIARSMEGQLTSTMQLDEADHAFAAELLPELEEIAGRILCNGFPTGVEVADSMMHGGPYPASTQSSTTSVGTLAIRRFLRPVSYQNFPAGLLPSDFGA